MTAHHRTAYTTADPARVLAVRCMISHISGQLDPGTGRTPNAAAQLLAQIELAYPGTVTARDQSLEMQLFTVRCSAPQSPVALLRGWQAAARLWLESVAR
jgi:hypothetical protein